jgi:hypothetical protein
LHVSGCEGAWYNMSSGDYNELLKHLPDEWRQTLWVMLTKARQMRRYGEDGQIVVVLKGGVPVSVRREDNTQIERGDLPAA